MEVHSEDYQGSRIAVYRIGDGFICIIYTGAFAYHVVEHYTETSGLLPVKFFPSVEEAVAHAKAQIDAKKLRP
jgi:hypothetical protein